MTLLTMLMHNEKSAAQTLLPSSTDLISPLPDSLGFAGMFAAKVGDEFIAAGGANFLNKMPWEGGKKTWHTNIFVYSFAEKKWEELSLQLPEALAYGVAVSYNDGVILFGGSGQDNVPSAKVYYLHKEKKEWQLDTWDDMPIAMVNMCGERIGDNVVLAGGSDKLDGMPTNQVLLFNLKTKRWSNLPTFPGAKRINAVSANVDGEFYLFSGIELLPEGNGKIKRNILHDVYRINVREALRDLSKANWEKLSDMPQGMAAGPLSAARDLKSKEILLFGGLDQETAQYADPVTHPGFLPQVLKYDIKTNTWSVIGDLPKEQIRLTLPSIQDGSHYYLISGEIGPGVRTNSILAIDLKKLK